MASSVAEKEDCAGECCAGSTEEEVKRIDVTARTQSPKPFWLPVRLVNGICGNRIADCGARLSFQNPTTVPNSKQVLHRVRFRERLHGPATFSARHLYSPAAGFLSRDLLSIGPSERTAAMNTALRSNMATAGPEALSLRAEKSVSAFCAGFRGS